MPSIWQMMQNGDNYLRHGYMIPPERPRTDVPTSLVVLSLVTNTVAIGLTLINAWTPVRTGMRAAAGSGKPRGLDADADVQ